MENHWVPSSAGGGVPFLQLLQNETSFGARGKKRKYYIFWANLLRISISIGLFSL